MNIAKRLLKPLLSTLGYDIRKVSHIGLEPTDDIKTIYRPKTPRVIFDVGAHQGETAVMFAREFPESQIHSFEPSSETFAALTSQVSRLKNVRSVNAALGSANGMSTLHVNRFSPTNSFLESATSEDAVDADLMQTVRTESVTVRSLDSYCEEAGINFIDLLKMDVQGFELEVLRGAKAFLESHKVALIYSEVIFERLYEGQPSFENLLRELVQHGFELVDLYGQARSAVQSVRWCDALFVHPEALAASRTNRLHGLGAS